MTTDNKTLADVQPGGRVRLGDQFSDWRFSEWWSGLPQDIGVLYPYDIAKLAWQAALSAQPSPGGQGDALLEEVARFLDYSVGHDPWPNIRRAYGDAWWEPVRKMRDDLRALAARQPEVK